MKGCVLVGKVKFPDGVVPDPVWPDPAKETAPPFDSAAASRRPPRSG
jgi:hypothetical protein